MKRNSLTTAILAGLTGVAGMAGVANAVNLNPDGLGQVLLYPYYTARESSNTLISVVNTNNEVKAVKVRFLEALNSREVLDFNLYLSPYDVWVAAITDLGDGVPGIRTPDTSCTVPYFYDEDKGYGEQRFLNFQYAQASTADGGPTGIERAASGYIEIIEMGNVEKGSDPAVAATHGSGFDCAVLTGMWSEGGGWAGGNSDAFMEPVSGGLFGTGSIYNEEDGSMVSYNATAIEGFWESGTVTHTDPGDLDPNLGQGDVYSYVFHDTNVVEDLWSEGMEAVDAVLMRDRIFNEYNVEADTAALSEWVVTFPTKRFHADNAPGGPSSGTTLPPFTRPWVANAGTPAATPAQACEEISYDFWDREERQTTEGVVVSPRPETDGFYLCREANVVRFARSGGTPESTELLKEPLREGNLGYVNFDLSDAGYENGWVQFKFGNTTSGQREIESLDENVHHGLPVIGFWALAYHNGAIAEGVLSNHAGAFNHHGSRRIDLAD